MTFRDAIEPPEARGLARDEVRLLAASPRALRHLRFRDLPDLLEPGDLVVVNTSATVAAAVDGRRMGNRPVVVHFATSLDDGTWVVELRPPGAATGPVRDANIGERVELPSGAWLTLLAAYPDPAATGSRLWRSRVAVEGPVAELLARRGRPVSYAYVAGSWPLSAYQTVFAIEPGSAEMASAGRPFTAELVTRLVAGGVTVAPVTLHAGLSSPELGEPPQAERYAVPAATAGWSSTPVEAADVSWQSGRR
jgi:S-adenosylmethionine:tRNA ribosyltransferase-isomerase